MSVKEFFARAARNIIDGPFDIHVFHGGKLEGSNINSLEVTTHESDNKEKSILNITLFEADNNNLIVNDNSSEEGDDNMAEGNPKDVSQGDELFAGDANTRAWDTNLKRTYDEYQDIALTAARRSQVQFDAVNNVSLQALQNAVLVANQVAAQTVKHTSDTDAQKVRHADIAIEGQWESAEEVALAQVAAHIAADHAPHE